MPKIVECGVCGKNFALTDAEVEICEQVAKEFDGEDYETKFMCKYCKKMIKKEVN